MLCLTVSALAVAQSTPFASERAEIVRAVLKGERERQAREFERPNLLSTESIEALSPAQLAADFHFGLVTPEQIKERAKGYVGVHYLAFKDFKIETGRAVVRVVVAYEVTGCFGPYQKQEKYFTFVLLRKDGQWQAERVFHPRERPFSNLATLSVPNFIRKSQ